MTAALTTWRTTTVVPFVVDLARHGGRLAVVTADEELTYSELAERAYAAGRRLGAGRRLVLVAGENSLDALVTYLGALAGGHVPMLVPAGASVAPIAEHYRPDVVAQRVGGEWLVEHRAAERAHDLHDDLALLLSTSGSTGSPKMVRLSHVSLQANAESIVEALGIQPDDRAITTLPIHYSYGLSVVHSHLLAGARLVLTDLSVVDPCFWDLAERTRPTSLAGVPHTFELLGRVGFAERAKRLGSLRQLTSAGGRLEPDAVCRWVGTGRDCGFDLVVMYGQTEATARMAVLPPTLAEEHPDSVGHAVPGGSFRVDNPGACGAGELVYSGPNVMLGYAHDPGDLALGREVSELRTGDIARITDAGLVQIVGRRSRFAKIVGLRIDLDRVTTLLAARDLNGRAVDLGDRIGVLVASADEEPRALGRSLASQLAIPYAAVEVRLVPELPLLPSGKPDLAGIRAHFADYDTASPRDAVGPTASMGDAVSEPAAADAAGSAHSTVPSPSRVCRKCGPSAAGSAHSRGLGAASSAHSSGAGAGDRLGRVLTAYRELLDQPHATEDDSFVALGGDSLSYVEVSIHLERILGDLPDGWHLMPVRDLAATQARPSRVPGWQRVETGIVLRALAILFVVVTHVGLAGLQGGAHALFALAGYNLARFHLGDEPRVERLRSIGASLLRVVLPAVAWIGGVALATGQYALPTVGLVNQVVGDRSRWSDQWSFWFIESIVYLLIGLGAALAIPAVDRLQRRWPWYFAMAVVALGLLGRYAILVPHAGRMRGGTAYAILWIFALGLAAAASRARWQRFVVSGVAIAAVQGFWPTQPTRELILTAGILLLVWVPSIRTPRVLARASGVLASASLYIYLTHWQVYPALRPIDPWLAVAGSIAVGLLYWQLVTWISRMIMRRRTSSIVP